MLSRETGTISNDGKIVEIWSEMKEKIDQSAKICNKEIKKEKEWFDTDYKMN